jgi:hypothetical protein
MKMPFRRSVAAALLLCLTAGWAPQAAYSCASVEPWTVEPDVRVRVAEESAIIVWDAKNGVEHFIRRATFDTGGRTVRDFGFLVPTPTVPELAEARDTAFDSLEKVMEPEIRHEKRYVARPSLLSCIGFGNKGETLGFKGSSRAAGAVAGGISVLHTQQVAGFDATVLEASDPAALNGWLKKHGYASRPALTEWLAPYIEKGWKITAFKIAKQDSGDPVVGSGSVRMSFKTDKPFFPYREPSDSRTDTAPYPRPRLLRVFFLGTERVRGILAGEPWKASVAWTAPLPPDRQSGLAAPLALTEDKLPPQPWMTVFEDRQTPRPGIDDVYFEGSSDQSKILPKPVIVYHNVIIPVYLELVLVALIWGGVRLSRRLRRANR